MEDLEKRYWLFEIYKYYPSGGFEDISLTSDDLKEVMEKFNKSNSDDKYIFDSLEKKNIIWKT